MKRKIPISLLVSGTTGNKIRTMASTGWICLKRRWFIDYPNSPAIEIQKMFGFNDVEWMQTRFYQQMYNEGLDEGKRGGRSMVTLKAVGKNP